MFKLILSLIFTLPLISCSHSKKVELTPNELLLKAAANNPRRTEKVIARNKYRHPVETLSFFGIDPEMTVLEVSPSGGWYTSILGPYLKNEGKLILAAYSPKSDKEYRRENTAKLKQTVKESPDMYGNVVFTVFESPKQITPIASKAASVDMVLTFRNTHGWIREGSAQKAFKEFFRVLKPGGVLGVVQHREIRGREQDPKAKSGYVLENLVIELAEKAGFLMDSRTNINANPLDTKDYEKGVWTLPPVYRLGDTDKEKYTKIGESDRMTLKFIKPAN